MHRLLKDVLLVARDAGAKRQFEDLRERYGDLAESGIALRAGILEGSVIAAQSSRQRRHRGDDEALLAVDAVGIIEEAGDPLDLRAGRRGQPQFLAELEIGRASCRERVCPYV